MQRVTSQDYSRSFPEADESTMASMAALRGEDRPDQDATTVAQFLLRIRPAPGLAPRHRLTMFFRKRDKDRDRYYLLPGMGKRLARKKRRVIWTWSIIAALLVSGILAAVLYWVNSGLPRR